ncbi:sporulation protein [Variovorax sp. J22P168]|uniref:sporulation protein n=1 Tax=Variovorax jilinensis TaxID=3053513 RepID=UPI0025763AC8|nr:sporulation protein [Variovorax sp. J22P168]MDM0014149.1 sporulation protein [Variovorax sp. J22P168]
MSARRVLVLLLVVNLGYFAWSRGGLAMFGLEPARLTETEPQRLQQQVRPQMLRIQQNPQPRP